jgi:tetratricopeptide (TPR) repeat protein
MQAGRHYEAGLLCEGALVLARRSGSILTQLGAALEAGVQLATGEPRRGLELFLEAADLAGRLGNRPGRAMALANAAETAIDMGELVTAERCLVQAAELAQVAEQGDGGPQLDVDGATLSQAMLDAYRGDVDRGLTALDELEERRRSQWDALQMSTWFLRTRSAVHLVRREWHAALADSLEAVSLDPSGANSSTSLWQGIQAAARLNDSDAVTTLLDLTPGLRGEWVSIVRATARATQLGLDGDPAAGDAFAAALARWRDRDLPLDHAFAAALAAHLLPPESVPADEVETARSFLTAASATGVLALL